MPHQPSYNWPMTQHPVPIPVTITPEAQKDRKSLSSSQDSCKSSHCFMGCVRREHKRKSEEALTTPMSNNRGSRVPVTPRHVGSCWPSSSIEWQPPWTLPSGWRPHSGNPRTWSEVWAISEAKEPGTSWHYAQGLGSVPPHEWHERKWHSRSLGMESLSLDPYL